VTVAGPGRVLPEEFQEMVSACEACDREGFCVRHRVVHKLKVAKNTVKRIERIEEVER